MTTSEILAGLPKLEAEDVAQARRYARGRGPGAGAAVASSPVRFLVDANPSPRSAVSVTQAGHDAVLPVGRRGSLIESSEAAGSRRRRRPSDRGRVRGHCVMGRLRHFDDAGGSGRADSAVAWVAAIERMIGLPPLTARVGVPSSGSTRDRSTH